MTLGEKITKLRTDLRMSQGDLAEKVGVSRQSISKWETDGSTPDLAKLIALSDIFQISIDQLVKDQLEIDQNQNNLSINDCTTEEVENLETPSENDVEENATVKNPIIIEEKILNIENINSDSQENTRQNAENTQQNSNKQEISSTQKTIGLICITVGLVTLVLAFLFGLLLFIPSIMLIGIGIIALKTSKYAVLKIGWLLFLPTLFLSPFVRGVPAQALISPGFWYYFIPSWQYYDLRMFIMPTITLAFLAILIFFTAKILSTKFQKLLLVGWSYYLLSFSSLFNTVYSAIDQDQYAFIYHSLSSNLVLLVIMVALTGICKKMGSKS